MSEKGAGKLLSMALLSVVGGVLSFISLQQHIALKLGLQQGPSFCNLSAKVNCDAVAASPWAELFGFPLAGLGLIFYVLIFLFSLVSLNSALIERTRSAACLLLVTFAGLVYSIYLLAISHFVIGSFCLLCLGMDLVNLALFLLSFRLAPGQGFIAGLIEGVGAVVAYPPFVFGLGSSKGGVNRLPARIALVTGLLLVWAGFYMPSVLAWRLKENNVAHRAAVVEKAVASWKAKSQEAIEVNPATDYSRGPQDAPIQVVEFSDYQCPACRMLYGVLEEVLKEFPDKVHFVLKNFPLDNKCNASVKREFHKFACLFAEFTRCAGEQNKFWEGVDFVFRLEMAQEVEPDEIAGLLIQGAEVFGMDEQALQSCIEEGRALPAIKSDIEQGLSMNIAGTPSLWINGRRFELVSPENIKPALQAVFQEILNSKK